MLVYTIQPGDTLWKVAQSNRVDLDALVAANPQIKDPNLIFVGQVIHIPQLWQPTIPEPTPGTPGQPDPPGGPAQPNPPQEEQTPEGYCTPPWGERPCIYLAREGDTLESIGHSFMLPLSRLLYFNLRYGKQEPLPEGARIVIPEMEIQPITPGRSCAKPQEGMLYR